MRLNRNECRGSHRGHRGHRERHNSNRRFFSLCVLCVLCGSLSSAFAAEKVSIALNWVPEPECGGIYAAKENGSYDKHNLDVDIKPGGAGAPTWQQVASGNVQFGV